MQVTGQSEKKAPEHPQNCCTEHPNIKSFLPFWIFSSCLFLCPFVRFSPVVLFSWCGKKALPRISAFIWFLTQRMCSSHPHQPALSLSAVSYHGNSIVNSNCFPVPQVARGTVISRWDGWCDARMRVGHCTSTFCFQHQVQFTIPWRSFLSGQ